MSILIIDESKEDRTLMRGLLARFAGVGILEAETGAEGLGIIQSDHPFLVIMNMHLPDQNGCQLLNQMFSDRTIYNTPVLLMMRGMSSLNEGLHSHLLDCVEILPQPVVESDLVQHVTRHLQLAKYREAIHRLYTTQGDNIEAMSESIVGLTELGKICYANFAASHLLKMPLSQLIGKYFESFLADAQPRVCSQWGKHPIYKLSRQQAIVQIKKCHLWGAKGNKILTSIAAVPIDPLYDLALVVAFKEQRESQVDKKLEHAGLSTSPTTGLSDRKRFEALLDGVLVHAKQQERHVSVLYIDMDHFKNINEVLGHETGDELIDSIGKRLLNCVAHKDCVAHLGGDNFAILQMNASGSSEVAGYAQKVLKKLKAPFLIGGHELFLGCCLGIATFPESGGTAAQLIQNADAAALRAKQLGSNQYQFFNVEMNKAIALRLELYQAMFHAIDNKELTMGYSPVVCTETQKVCGYEVQIFWCRPGEAVLSFDQYIDVLEETGLLAKVMLWGLQQVCAKIKREEDAEAWLCFPMMMPVFFAEDFMKELHQVMEEEQIHNQLWLDIVLPAHKNQVEKMLSEVKSTIDSATIKPNHWVLSPIQNGGFSFAMLQYLPGTVFKVNLDILKNEDESQQQSIAEALITLAKARDLKVWVNGVDSESQLSWLKTQTVDWVQGDLAGG